MHRTGRSPVPASLAVVTFGALVLAACTGPVATADTVSPTAATETAATATATADTLSPSTASTAGAAGTGEPVFRTVPAPDPSPPSGAVCPPSSAADPSYAVGTDLVTVDQAPSAVTERWLSAFDPTSCVVVAERGATVASQLANAIRTADSSTYNRDGTFNCAADRGLTVELYFSYPGRAEPEIAVVHPTGCETVWAPGRAPRNPEAVYDLLLTDAPPTWPDRPS